MIYIYIYIRESVIIHIMTKSSTLRDGDQDFINMG